MRTALSIFALVAVVSGPFLYDASGYSRCVTGYARSFDGLWLIKERRCYGRLGLPDNPREVKRKALFEAF